LRERRDAWDVLFRFPRAPEEWPALDDVSRVERNPKVDGAVVEAMETRATRWLTAALFAGGNPDRKMPRPICGHETVLCHGARVGYEDGVRLLLRFGADPNKEGWLGMTALAEGARHPAIVALLLEKGANPNPGRADSLFNPLVSAARVKSIESLRLMLAHGGDATRVDRYGGNVLHAALEDTSAECCRELLAHGADVSSRGNDDETPLHVAVREAYRRDGPERVKILDLLLDAGASLLITNRKGLTPGQVAHKYQRTSREVLRWFYQHRTV
jgi:hypothetical protein